MVVRNVRATTPLRGRGRRQNLFLQMLIVIVVAALAPLAMSYILAGSEVIALDSTRNSQLASVAAALAALVVVRQVTGYPGVRGFATILPAVLATYALAAATLLVGRLAYSGTMLTSGLLLVTVTMFVLTFIAQRGAPVRFFILPGSEQDIIADTPGIEWSRLEQPVVPANLDAAIVADLRADWAPEWERMLAAAAIAGHTVYHTKQLHESLTGRVRIDHLSENNFGSLVPNLAYLEVKRLIDVLAALVLLPVLLVPMLLVGIAIRLDSPGPALFRQRRMGYRGAAFEVVKFRTMAHGGDGGHDPITRSDDARITRLGRWLRRFRIDELPQLWNVLRGEMSMIGPRPEAVGLSEWYERELPFYGYRHIVRPGITGWAQINQGHVAALDDVLVKLQYDFYYIKNFSAWIDILITMRTCAIMLSGFGSK